MLCGPPRCVSHGGGACYHVTQAVVVHVKVGGVRGVRDLGQVGGGEFVQGAPVQVAEEGVAPEVSETPGAQPLLPLADQPCDEGAGRVRHLGAQRGELKVILEGQILFRSWLVRTDSSWDSNSKGSGVEP